MNLLGIKVSSIWRCVILLSLSMLLHGCTSYTANIKEGSFDVNLPKPFWGAGTYIYPDEIYIRGTLSYSIEDKELLPLKDIEKDGFPKQDGCIKYAILGTPFSGSLDVFFKKWYFGWGGRLVLEPYPSGILFVGINGLHGEYGFGLRFGYSRDKVRYSGQYIYTPCSIDGCMSETIGDFQEEHSNDNVNLGVYTYSSFFVSEFLSLNFSTGLYQPWFLKNEVYLEDVPTTNHDYDINFFLPFLFSQYVGATYTLLNHIQFSAGETVYYTPYSDKFHWQTNFSISYLF